MFWADVRVSGAGAVPLVSQRRAQWRVNCDHCAVAVNTPLSSASGARRRAERYTAAHSPFHSSSQGRPPLSPFLTIIHTCLAKLRPTFLLNGSLRTRTKSCKLIKYRWDWSVPQLKVDWTSFLQRPKKCNCAWWKEKQIMLSCWFSIFYLKVMKCSFLFYLYVLTDCFFVIFQLEMWPEICWEETKINYCPSLQNLL